jgi:hypothetical protein
LAKNVVTINPIRVDTCVHMYERKPALNLDKFQFDYQINDSESRSIHK